MRKYGWLMVVLMVMVSMFLNTSVFAKKGKEWKVYQGTIPGYSVNIDESREGGKCDYIVHLIAADSTVTTGGITGHDYDSNLRGGGDWDRVFRCGYPESHNGCNSVIATAKGWQWDPCPADEHRVTPFTTAVIKESVALLDRAIAAVYNGDHLVTVWANGVYSKGGDGK